MKAAPSRPRGAQRSPTPPLVERATLVTWLALLGLVAATVALAYVPMGRGNTAASLAIAAAKAALVMTVFMKLAHARPLIRIFALAVFLWLAMLLAMTMTDFLTQPR